MIEVFLRALGHSGLPGIQSLLWRLGVYSGKKDAPFEIAWKGLLYRGNRRFWIDRYIFFQGAYAPAELDFLEKAASVLRLERASLTMLDIGANVGQHSLAMARRYDRILAFEPSASVSARLKGNIKHNSLSNIEVFDVALGDKNEAAILGSGLDGNDGSRSLNWSLGGGDEVIVRHAGEFLSSIVPPVPRFDVIKLDVEGHEKAVLTAMHSRIIQDRPIILFELVGSESKGGFENLGQLAALLYPDHLLFALTGRKQARLVPFDWEQHEEAVCLPVELAAHFKGLA
jgi:FkbM family methyltransferase